VVRVSHPRSNQAPSEVDCQPTPSASSGRVPPAKPYQFQPSKLAPKWQSFKLAATKHSSKSTINHIIFYAVFSNQWSTTKYSSKGTINDIFYAVFSNQWSTTSSNLTYLTNLTHLTHLTPLTPLNGND
jgi:hypothetical protein